MTRQMNDELTSDDRGTLGTMKTLRELLNPQATVAYRLTCYSQLVLAKKIVHHV
jgi:hypothetical protein